MLKHTPLFQIHRSLGAKLIPFAGWEMPLHYGSQIQEHTQVRHGAGVFDVSHMTLVDLFGSGVRDYLRYLLANDVGKFTLPGKALYTCMLNPQGGIIDDLIVYFIGDHHYRLVLNAATREKDLSWMTEQAQGFHVDIQERKNLALLAVQGPQSMEKTLPLLGKEKMCKASALQPFECVLMDEWFIARTGYTGEPGFEIAMPAEVSTEFWNALLEVGVHPIGLGARDSLRLEAGYGLYGVDMDDTTTPLDVSLGWTVAWQPESRIFLGRQALTEQMAQGSHSMLVGLQLEDKGILRRGQQVMGDKGEEGVVTSGTFSPMLGCSIALARLPKGAQGPFHVVIRGKSIPAKRIKMPFYKAQAEIK